MYFDSPPLTHTPQGFLMVVLLLLVLWLPLLVFSSGAPTYQTPTVVNAAVNISLVSGAALGCSSASALPLGQPWKCSQLRGHTRSSFADAYMLHRLVVMPTLDSQASVRRTLCIAEFIR